MPEKAAAPVPRKGLLLRLLRILAWLLMIVALVCVALYLAFGPAQLYERLRPPPPVFPEHVDTTEAPTAPVAAAPVPPPQLAQAPADSRELATLMLGSIEDIWGEFLARGDYAYKKPKLVFYEGSMEAPCKLSGRISGLYYCAKDMRLYLDLAYLDELRRRSPQVGDLARSYAVAHEAAHHIQNLVGVAGWFKEFDPSVDPKQAAEALHLGQELVTDCLVGSWVAYAQRKYGWLKPDDMEAALKAVVALGEERTRAQDTGQPTLPDPMTLGRLETRLHWLNVGIESGDPRECGRLFSGVEE
ncbi:neutral zinc metallopeptidase [Pseudomonas sp. Q1-7]|uniref:neutral zinc metallopeptidase n=1 Tax=Pseudomonas sp. Q1-7 TaxID=3020843 RepID=UPI0022FFDA62|nr:neutral zinc metallopeptidase [Pseudomonas sp. Q1-7]